MRRNSYTGVGSRSTPEKYLEVCRKIAIFMSNRGYILRSGGAVGADAAFESGCNQVGGLKEIYLPWKNYNYNKSELYNISKNCYKLAKQFHPCYNKLSSGAAKLIARDGMQVLGKELNDPTKLLICYAEIINNEEVKGGTGQAVRIARYYDIPVVNLIRYNNYYDAIIVIEKILSY